MSVADSSSTLRLPLLVIDGDCAFCQASAQRGARLIRRFPTVVPWQRLVADGHLQVDSNGPRAVSSHIAATGLTIEDCNRAVQYVASDGAVYPANDAVSALLLAAGRGWWVVGALMRLPGVRHVCAVAYRWVARHRHQLPGGSERCSLSSAASSSSAR